MNPTKPSPATAVSLAQKDMDLGLSWKDPSWPQLSAALALDYFSQFSNPFYDQQCNNEVIKMQRQSLDNLKGLVGIEYELAHVQEPILYVVRKQHRYSPTETVPQAYYYILAGDVFQAPDLWSVMNSRLLNTSHFLYSAAADLNNFVRYHPSNGYHWEIKNTATGSKSLNFAPMDAARKEPEEAGTQFQRKNVDHILSSLTQRFPFKPMPTSQHPYGPRVLTEQTTNSTSAPMAPPAAEPPAAPTERGNIQNPPARTGQDHQLFNSVKNSR